jgi:hypothetical protein
VPKKQLITLRLTASQIQFSLEISRLLGSLPLNFNPSLDSIRAAVDDGNWLAALALTLMLPDICASIETPNESVGQRYTKWWRKNFRKRCRYGNWPSDHVKGEEVYLLRCAYLHEGSDSWDPASSEVYA